MPKKKIIPKKSVKKSQGRNQFMLGIVVAIIVAFGIFFYRQQSLIPGTAPEKFICSDGKFIDAVFQNDIASLTLSDDRAMDLPKVVSTDGVRYANDDESIIFWIKDGGASMQENGTKTFDNCVNR